LRKLEYAHALHLQLIERIKRQLRRRRMAEVPPPEYLIFVYVG
jgi:hypothetical protein